MIAVRLPTEIEKRIAQLAARTGRTKTYCTYGTPTRKYLWDTHHRESTYGTPTTR